MNKLISMLCLLYYTVHWDVAVLMCLLLLCGDVEPNPGPCTILDESQVADMKGLTFSHLNIRSLLPKLDDVKHMLQKTKLNFLLVSETWLNDKVLDAEVEISNYVCHRQDRDSHVRARGGVCFPTWTQDIL